MTPVQELIEQLKLQPHPEGGFYRETYRSGESIARAALPPRFTDGRNFSTAIYFLLRSKDRSLFHRIKSDELWHFHAGTSLNIYILNGAGLTTLTLGSPDFGGAFQVMVPANSWFGAMVNEDDSYVLAGCTVSPGFDFQDFEMAKRETLLKEFPAHHEIIRTLTNGN